MCTATIRAEWETLKSYGNRLSSDWFPNGVDSTYFAPMHESYHSICFAWTTTQTKNACSISARTCYQCFEPVVPMSSSLLWVRTPHRQ